jgi:PadR family transcriptional regulator PadR
MRIPLLGSAVNPKARRNGGKTLVGRSGTRHKMCLDRWVAEDIRSYQGEHWPDRITVQKHSCPALVDNLLEQRYSLVENPLEMAEQHPMQLLQGTLDMLILRTLIFGPLHGHGIAVTIQRTSGEDLLIDHGSLYPALQRLERQGLLKSRWGTSELNRRARFYELTPAGRRKLAMETGKWERMVRAIGRILEHPKEEET